MRVDELLAGRRTARTDCPRELGCNLSINDMADRPPRSLHDEEIIDLGSRRVRRIETPHVPHGWDAGLLYEETIATLFCGDLFTAVGQGPATTDHDIIGPAIATEDIFGATCITPTTGATIRSLANLHPRTLGLMHGPSYTGDADQALTELAAAYDQRLATEGARFAVPSVPGTAGSGQPPSPARSAVGGPSVVLTPSGDT